MTALQLGPYGRNRLLEALTPSDLGLLSPYLRNVPHLLGTRLHETGDPIETIYFPQSGMISLLAVMEDGHAIEMATVRRESAVGIMAAWVGISATGRAAVQLDGTFSQMSGARFREAIRERAPAFAIWRGFIAMHR